MNVAIKYRLTRSQRRVLADYAAGNITVTAAAARLKTSRQNVDRYVAAIAKHAASTGLLNFEEIIKHY